MLLLYNFDIVFQEVPGETTLALNLSNCPNRCPGCHSAHLQEAVGEPLTEELLDELLERYGNGISCVAFMGGDNDPEKINNLSFRTRNSPRFKGIKTAWYSGRSELPPEIEVQNLNFLKLGSYLIQKGDLSRPTTNQRFYRIEKDGTFTDQTILFQKKSLSSQNNPGKNEPAN
jgi:anaerobic ribonucleoside-triphosphate reductase activating protein